jgi:hypothetical protein
MQAIPSGGHRIGIPMVRTLRLRPVSMPTGSSARMQHANARRRYLRYD